MDWTQKKVLVTGGCSFIGSHLVDALVERGAKVRVVDDLSSGKLENIQEHIDADRVAFLEADLTDNDNALLAVLNIDIVFHLAADHGGRGYVDLHQAECATNLGLDANVFKACKTEGVDKVIYASSGCVYPNRMPDWDGSWEVVKPHELLFLSEDEAGPPYDADGMYGWAKLMGEKTLKAFCDAGYFKGVSCRYFTVYGPRGHENHAIMAMVARAFIKQDPFVVWGDGQQIRNWTHVSDIVRGTILAAERIDDATAVNLGTMERISVINAAREILSYTGHDTTIEFHPDMPTGPLNRVADNALARKLLGWYPEIPFNDGLKKTIDWYASTKDAEEVAATLEGRLTER